jgi:hypothetical protein
MELILGIGIGFFVGAVYGARKMANEINKWPREINKWR